MPADSPKFPSLKSPARIQQFLDESIRYNLEPRGATCYSPRMVLRKRVAHCMEGALFAAAALRRIGYPALLVDLEAVRDTDHVLAVYKQRGCWGSLAKSNYAGLGSREPVYRTLRELALSYVELYCNDAGEKTLRAFSTRPIDLRRFDAMDWENVEGDVWEIPNYLCEVAHTRLLTPQQERGLIRMRSRLFEANYVGHQLPGGVSIRITPRPPRH
jgi:hypothetical protein